MSGLRRAFCTVLVCLVVLGPSAQVSYASDPYAPLETFIQAEGFIPHFPLTNTIHPGGLAKLCGGSKVYEFIPSAMGAQIPATVPASFTWPAASGTKQTTVGLLVNAIGGILSGVNISATVNAGSNVTLKEIDAGGLVLQYDPISVLGADPILRQEVRNYQSAKCKIFLVTAVATSNALSFTTDTALGASIHLNDTTTAPACTPPPPPVAPAPATPAPGAAAPAAAAPAAAPATASKAVAPAAPSTPSAQLSACLTNGNTITLNSPNALVFAVSLTPLNTMPPEPAAPMIVVDMGGTTDLAAAVAHSVVPSTPSGAPTLSGPLLVDIVKPDAAPSRNHSIMGVASPTAPENVLTLQYRKANLLDQP